MMRGRAWAAHTGKGAGVGAGEGARAGRGDAGCRGGRSRHHVLILVLAEDVAIVLHLVVGSEHLGARGGG